MSLKIYKASAGSGKTYTLTQEYLRQLLRPGTQVRNILAITFTNAATADMKRKIVETLAQLAKGEYDGWKELAAPKETKAQLQVRAKEKLHEVLHQYQDFSIKTIDSFVQNIIKPFAFELGLPRNYTAELELDRLSEEITLTVLDRYGRKGYEKISGYLDKYLQKQERDQKSLRIQEKITDVVGLLFKENSIAALDRLEELHTDDFETVINNIERIINRIYKQAEDALKQARQAIAEHNLQPGDFQQGSRGVYAWFTLNEPDLKKFSEPGATVQKSASQGILKKDGPAVEPLTEAYEKLCGLDFSTYFLLKEVQNAVYSVALLNHAREILRETEEKTAGIPISEFNRKIDQALSEEGNDFIFERCGTRYRHIFIDEFQDTSRLQWKNLRPLIENNVAQGNDCLIVGDAKQSLYRFRNADMEQFVGLCEGKDPMETRVETLSSNWRSARGIIAFNNKFYDFIKDRYPLAEGLAETVYADHKQYYKNETKSLPEEDTASVRIYQVKNADNEFAAQWYLKQILKILERHNPGDVAVLCRRNEQCRTVSDFLVANGYKVSTPDSLNLASHAGLALVVASLEYIYYKHGFYKAKTFNLARNLGLWNRNGQTTDSADAYAIFTDPSTNRRFEELAALNRRQADLYDTVEAVMRFWGMESRTDQYLLCFLDQIPAQNLKHIPDLASWWQQYAATTPVAAAAQDNSIRVMSIHKSKGLEFKTVIMPFISDNRMHTDQLFWTGPGVLPAETGLPDALVRYVSTMSQTPVAGAMQREKLLNEIDNLNALYVATTRPCEKLYLLNKVPSKDSTGFNANCAVNLFAEENPGYLEYEEDGNTLTVEEETGSKPETASETPVPEPVSAQTVPEPESRPWRARLQEAPIGEQETPEQEWGNFIHTALSQVEIFSEPASERALQTALTQYPGFKDRIKEAAVWLKKVCTHRLLKKYFDGTYRVKTECPLTDGKTVHIPDRLILDGDRAVILDYKTGERSDLYAQQVRGYMQLLSDMGYKTEGYLVYLHPLAIEEV